MLPSPAINPYIAGPSLGDERSFFGRADIMREVETTLRNPAYNTIILYGQPAIGKTSLLLQLQHRLPTPPFVAIYFDLTDKALTPVDQVFYELALTTTAQVGLSPPSSADFADNPSAFQRLFLPGLYQALGQEYRPIFLLDEFNLPDHLIQDIPETAAARAIRPYLHHLMLSDPRPAFIFAAGRWLEQLSIIAQTPLRTGLSWLISTLGNEEARALILQAERKGYLIYADAAIERILALTKGHPYLTQLLCQSIFERIVTSASTYQRPTVTVADVEAVLPIILAEEHQVYRQIWAGLPSAKRPGYDRFPGTEPARGGGQEPLPEKPGSTQEDDKPAPTWLGAERIVLAAMAAQTREGAIFSQDDIAAALEKAGIQPQVKELQQAPKNLVEWQVLEEVPGGYRFRVELMRRWVATHQPLDQVKAEELEFISPVATVLYQAARAAYQRGDRQKAKDQLRRALAANPNHVQARLQLGRILREEGRLDEARAEFETAHKLDQAAGQAELGQTLFQQGQALEQAGDKTGAQAAYKRALLFSPQDPKILARQAALTQKKPAEPKTPVQEKQRKSSRLWAVVAALLLLLLLLLCGWWWAGQIIPGQGTSVAVTTSPTEGLNGTPQVSTATQAGIEAGQETPLPESPVSMTALPSLTSTQTAEAAATGQVISPTLTATLTATPTQELSGSIRVAGSTSMQPLALALAQAFTSQHPDVQINIQGGSSTAGVEAVGQGTVEVGLAARAIDPVQFTSSSNLKIVTVARDAVVIATHPLVSVKDLTLDQVRDIFAGNITNWGEVGEVEAPLQVIVPAVDSDVRVVFESMVLGQNGLITTSALEQSSERGVQNRISTTPYAIGFLSLRQLDQSAKSLLEAQPPINFTVLDNALVEINMLSLDGVIPDPDVVTNGLYPIVQPFNMITRDDASEIVQAWLDFSLGLEGQRLVLEAGYAPAQ